MSVICERFKLGQNCAELRPRICLKCINPIRFVTAQISVNRNQMKFNACSIWNIHTANAQIVCIVC